MSTRLKSVQRSKGQSVVEEAAYALRTKLYDQNRGRIWNDLIHKTADKAVDLGTILPSGQRIDDPAKFWSRAELAEKRKNAITGRTWRLALPIEFSPKEQDQVLTEYCAWMRGRFGTATTCGKHLDHRHNPHAHIIFGAREVDEAGNFGAKVHDFDKKRTASQTIREMRQKWADMCNEVLLRHDYAPISALSYKKQGLDVIPGIHRGPARHYAMLKEAGFYDPHDPSKMQEYEDGWYKLLMARAARDQHEIQAIRSARPGTTGRADDHKPRARPGRPSDNRANIRETSNGDSAANRQRGDLGNAPNPTRPRRRPAGHPQNAIGNLERREGRSAVKPNTGNLGTPRPPRKPHGRTEQGAAILTALAEWREIIDLKTLGGFYDTGKHRERRRHQNEQIDRELREGPTTS